MMSALDHIGIAVDDPDAVAALYEKLLHLTRYKKETLPQQNLRTHFVEAGSAKLELLEALGPDSSVARFLDKNGEGLHHLAFETPDLGAAFARVQEKGFEPLDAPQPGADGKRIFFLHPRQTHGVLVEFCQQVNVSLDAEYAPMRSGQIAVYERGNPQRPTLLLLHGLGGSAALEMAPLLHHLETHFHVLALDLPAHGASDDFADEELSFDLLTESLLAALDHIGVAQAHAFGFSLGGAVALHAALQRSDRIRRLAVHATCFDWTDERAADLQTYFEADTLSDAALHHLEDVHGSTWQERLDRFHRFAGHLPVIERAAFDFEHLRAPVLLSAFDDDPLFDLDLTLRLRERLPNARLTVLPGERHSARTLPLDAYVSLLTDWLSPN